MSVASHRRSLKHRVVYSFLRRLDYSLKQRRDCVIGQQFDMSRQRFVRGVNTHLRRRREGDRIVSAAV